MPASEGPQNAARPALPVCNALWVGPSLGPLEAGCLASFAEAGHPVDLHVFDPPLGVPSGIRLVDASLTVPRDRLVRHRKTGSFSLFSNLFRYALMAAGRGLWIDCDVLCLRPISDGAYIFGREGKQTINGAVLKLPSDDPVLGDLMAIFSEAGWIPPWASLARRLRYRLRYLVEPGFGLADMSWGTAGPAALTYHLQRRGLTACARLPEVFYPVGPRETGLLTRSDAAPLAARITPQTLCIHLWNKSLSESEQAVAGSLVSRIADGSWRAALGIGPPAGP